MTIYTVFWQGIMAKMGGLPLVNGMAHAAIIFVKQGVLGIKFIVGLVIAVAIFAFFGKRGVRTNAFPGGGNMALLAVLLFDVKVFFTFRIVRIIWPIGRRGFIAIMARFQRG